MRTQWIILFLLLGFASSLQGEERPALTLCQAITIALDQNPAIRAASFGVQVADEQIDIQRSQYFPNLTAYAIFRRFRTHIFLPNINLPLPVPFTFPSVVGPIDDYSLGVRSRFLLFDSGRRGAQMRYAKAQAYAAFEDASTIERNTILNVMSAFYTLLADEEIVEVAKDQRDRSENHLWIVRQRKEVGDVPLIDVYRSEVELSNAEQTVIQAQTEVDIARGNLNIALGLPPTTCIAIQKERTDIDHPDDKALCQAIDNAMLQRPEIKASSLRLQAFFEQIREARSAFGPTLTAEGLYGRRDDNFFPHDKDWAISLNFEWNLFEGWRATHTLRQAHARLQQAEAEHQRLQLAIQQEVWNAFTRLKQAYSLLATIRTQIRSAQESLRLAENRYRVGAGTLNDLFDTQVALTRVQADYVEAHWNYLIALATFRWSQGMCL